MIIFPETFVEASEHLLRNVFSFGKIAIEVRSLYLATYSVGGGDKNNLSSAQGFYKKVSIWFGHYFNELGCQFTAESAARSTRTGSDGLIAGDDISLLATRLRSATKYGGSCWVST